MQFQLQQLRFGQFGRSTGPSGVGRLMEVRSLLQQMAESFQQAAAALGYQDAVIRRAVSAARRRGALTTKPWQQLRR